MHKTTGFMATNRNEKGERKSFSLKVLMAFLLFQPLCVFSMNLDVNVTSAGNLVNQVDLAQIEQIQSLILHGELNGTDILVIRKMKGLEYLDMTDTKIVNGGDSYYDEYISSENTIGSYFFDNPNLATIYLPNTIISIDEHAFENFTSLTNITIPNSVENIESDAFNGCTGLVNITIPASVTKIGWFAFSNCKNLKKIDFKEASATISISPNSFNSCPLEQIVLGRNLSYYFDIDDYYTESKRQSPFSRKSTLKSVVIKPSVTFIDDFLFYKCTGITEISIPNSVKSIGIDAFRECTSLKKLIFENGDTELELRGIESEYSRGTCTFEDCPLEEIYLGRTLDYNDENGGVFSLNTEKLTTLTISNHVTKIANFEFARASIERITIPKSVKRIGHGAFCSCEKLKVVILEDGQAELNIEEGRINDIPAFGECPLDSVYLGRDLDSYYSSSPFEKNVTLRALTIGESVSIIRKRTFAGCTNLKTVKIPNSVSIIEDGAFRDCESLSSIILSQSITSISQNTFYGCTSLQSIDIPNSVLNIGSGAFRDCNSLTSVVFPNELTDIGSLAFANCRSLTTVAFPNTLKNIGGAAFSGCIGLTSLTIPFSVTNIEDGAFEGCVELVEINSLNTTPPAIKENTFDTVTYTEAVLNVPLNCKTIYWLHPYWENFYNIVEKDFLITGIVENVFEKTDCGYSVNNYGITFTKENKNVKIYTIQGGLLYNGKSSIGQTINLPPNTVYIVKIGKQTTKVAF